MASDAAPTASSPPLEAASEFEYRIDMGKTVGEPDIRSALASGDTGFLHSYTTGSAVDGPGLRMVAWTTACMFRCKFCHNPDTWTLSNGMPVTLDRAIAEVAKYANGLNAMGGGFTLSGGEPLMQHRFAARLFAGVKALGVHTALESNGFNGDKLSDDEIRTIDLVILDLKAFHPEQHERVTGVRSNERILDFALRLASLGRPIWLRHVLVPGLTDVDEELEALAAFAAALGNVERVEILPFHQMGRFKWERLGLEYQLADTPGPSTHAVAHASDIFRAAGLYAP